MAIPTNKRFIDALVRAGFMSANDLRSVTKITVVVGGRSDDLVQVTIERLGDEPLLNAINEFKED